MPGRVQQEEGWQSAWKQMAVVKYHGEAHTGKPRNCIATE